jgi:hypothetical protein
VPDDKAQRNFTDPDSRIMKTADGLEQAYNAQAAVDADSQVTVSAELTNAANDKQQVEPMVAEIERQTGRRPRELSADGGYCSESNLEHLSECGIRGYVATGRQKHGQASATGSKTGGPQTRAMAVQYESAPRWAVRTRAQSGYAPDESPASSPGPQQAQDVLAGDLAEGIRGQVADLNLLEVDGRVHQRAVRPEDQLLGR